MLRGVFGGIVILITKELLQVDHLPNAAHVDVHTVAALFGCKVPTVWARLRRKEIPAPRKFGAHTRWNLGEIREALKGDRY
jgi:predicted DNA-binding transcriptional regulator AlpA